MQIRVSTKSVPDAWRDYVYWTGEIDTDEPRDIARRDVRVDEGVGRILRDAHRTHRDERDAFDARGLEELRRIHGESASFLIVADPLRGTKRGVRLGFTELASLMIDVAKGGPNSDNNSGSSKR